MHVKVVWVTMLAMADSRGRVLSSLPGMAHIAGVSMEQCQDAIAKLTGPDPYSRTKEHEGRRIQECDGGWLLLNYLKYREMRDQDERRIQTREAVSRHRARKHVSQSKPQKAQEEAEEEAERTTENRHVANATVGSESAVSVAERLKAGCGVQSHDDSQSKPIPKLVDSRVQIPADTALSLPPICFLEPPQAEAALLVEIQTRALPEVEAVEYWKAKAGVSPRSADVVKAYVARARKRLSEGLTLEQLKGAVDGALADDFWRAKARDLVAVWKDFGRVLELDGLRNGRKPVRGKSYMTEPGALVTETAAPEDMEHVRKLQAEFRQRESERAEKKGRAS